METVLVGDPLYLEILCRSKGFALYTTVHNLDDDGLCSLGLAIRCAAYFLVHDLDEIFHYYHGEWNGDTNTF